MKQTKKEKQKQQNKEFCKKYLTANWDGCAANDYFANMCGHNSPDNYFSKPKNELFDSLREIAIVTSELYSSIAPLAFEKEKIVTYLKELTPDKIFVPENVSNPDRFRNTFLATGKDILTKIEEGAYDFQKTSNLT